MARLHAAEILNQKADVQVLTGFLLVNRLRTRMWMSALYPIPI